MNKPHPMSCSCGTVDKVIISHTREPEFEPHQEKTCHYIFDFTEGQKTHTTRG